MRLGFWNRLAVVGFFLALIVAPLAFMADTVREISELRETMYQPCLKSADKTFADPEQWLAKSKAVQKCIEQRYPIPEPNPVFTWNGWWNALQATAGVYGIFYALIWIMVATCKWVWRGRASGIK